MMIMVLNTLPTPYNGAWTPDLRAPPPPAAPQRSGPLTTDFGGIKRVVYCFY